MHVQSVQKYCFSLSNTQICGVFCCRRRRGCLSSLFYTFLLWSRNLQEIVPSRFQRKETNLKTRNEEMVGYVSLHKKTLTALCIARKRRLFILSAAWISLIWIWLLYLGQNTRVLPFEFLVSLPPIDLANYWNGLKLFENISNAVIELTPSVWVFGSFLCKVSLSFD